MQIREIYEHKYYLSEKVGYDVGISYAAEDWVKSGQADRFRMVYTDNMSGIETICDSMCGEEKCMRTEEGCILKMHEIHKLLGDT